MSKLIRNLMAVSLVFGFSASANAGLLLVEQYDDFQSNNVNDLINYANNNAASTSALWGSIDFTDDPNGFAGDIPGSNPWPSAAEIGATGTSHPINDTFFARITGDFSVSAADTFHFQTYNDDGIFLFIDGDLIISDTGYHPESRHEGTKLLGVGIHSIEMYFFENGGEASLEFTVADSSLNYVHFDDPAGPVVLSSVPEPSTIILMALGVLGLSRKKIIVKAAA